MINRLSALTAVLLLPASAHAFCGTYVGQPGAELYANTSQVVLTRQDDRTVLTLANDYEGELTEFAMLIPVPVVLDEKDVSVVENKLLNRIAQYSGPRLVEYECADFYWDEMYASNGMSCGCSDDAAYSDAEAGAVSPPALDVDVENEFTVGEYEIVILSSGDSADLVTWLNREGYGITQEAQDLLGEYIEADSYFFAAKVNLDELPGKGTFLRPLQVSYESESFSLPIRLGTINSPGSQDLIMYALTSADEGSVGISNYPEAIVEHECLYDVAKHGEFTEFVGEQFTAAVDKVGDAAWVKEYTWSPSGCDPCPPGGALEADVANALGWVGSIENAQLTRLRMRYTPEAVTEDLALYTSGGWDQSQLRYIVYKHELESMYPICREGTPTDPGSCDESTERQVRRSTVPSWPLIPFLGFVGVVGLALRRRQTEV